ncbi:hypothetical protein TNCV_937001 [Trichonephila clavipes]|nr:hypothetical protein TNCV_937001 [Trichonephila clavipes]
MVQKTVFGLDIIPETILPQLIENGFNLGNLRKMKRVDRQTFNYIGPPQPVIILEPPVQTPEQIPATPELTTSRPPVQIPDPLVQLFLPDPPQQPVQILLLVPPVVETLEPTLTDDTSIDQIISSIFGDCSQKGIQATRLISKNPRCLKRCLHCLTRVIIASHSWIILKQGWPQSNKKHPWT